MMMRFTKWISATMAVVLFAGAASAANTVANGKVKSINADNASIVVTDADDKEFTFKLGDKVIVNRAGKESKSDLKAGDSVSICYDKGLLTWTAHYILVKEGDAKNNGLIPGNIKSYDADKQELTFTNSIKADSTYAMGKAQVRVDMKDAKIESIKIGDHALLIVETVEGQPTLRSVMVHRAK